MKDHGANSRLYVILLTVVRLCLFCPWLTFIFGAKMADITLDTFHLHTNDEQ